jgi:hypothetical protein
MNRLSTRFALGIAAAVLLFALSGQAMAKELQGKVSSIAPDDMMLAISDKDGGEFTFRILVTSKVLIDQKERRLSDLQAGDQVAVVFDFDDKEMVATLIRCKRD